MPNEIATLGGGCFWCLEAVYNKTVGVASAISGYAGGQQPDPNYDQVCSGATGHVEVVQVTFDPAQITYRDILEIFFVIHDATTLNRQGNDVGTQYRSVIYYHSPEQKATAEAVIQELKGGPTIVTTVEPLPPFYKAEAYHQRYFENNPNQGYCAYVVSPKVEKFKKNFASRVR